MEKASWEAVVQAVIYQLYADRLNNEDVDLDKLKKLLAAIYTEENRVYFIDMLDEVYLQSLNLVQEHKELTGY
jgi:uncharacterized protein YqfB (UPF0267 family)